VQPLYGPDTPPELDVTRDGDGYIIKVRWFQSKRDALNLLVFALFVGGFVFVLPRTEVDVNPLVVASFLGVFVTYGAYLALAIALNVTTFEVRPEGLTVRHGPIPTLLAELRGERPVQLSVVQHVKAVASVRAGPTGGSQRDAVGTYVVCATLPGNRLVAIGPPLRNPVTAQWIEQRIERTLGIGDQPYLNT
jgi:hypothetical protein